MPGAWYGLNENSVAEEVKEGNLGYRELTGGSLASVLSHTKILPFILHL